jgi:hypothetical protein
MRCVLVKPCSSESRVRSCLLQEHLGSFNSEAEAAEAYDKALALFGRKAVNVSWAAAILRLLLGSL